MSDFKPHADARIIMSAIVCIFENGEQHTVVGLRHWDCYMVSHGKLLQDQLGRGKNEEQGFIDQYRQFYTREQAMELVKSNGQPFDFNRNGHQDEELFSEGVW